MFEFRVPESLARLPGRVHTIEHDRRCRACGMGKPASEFYARRAVCKRCIKARSRAWEKANPARRRVSKAAWDKAHRPQRNAYMRDWNRRRKQA